MRSVVASGPPGITGNSAHDRRRHIQRKRKQLKDFDINCKCKCSLVVECAVTNRPGCSLWHRELKLHGRGRCTCEGRMLPGCLLDPATPRGCSLWREGKWCGCEQVAMPMCLCAGCAERQKGYHCECPRTTTERCPHLLALIRIFERKFAGMDFNEIEAYADQWAAEQRRCDPEKYSDPPLPDGGEDMSDREEAVSIMTVRHDGGRALHHPDDDGNARKRRAAPRGGGNTRAIAYGFRRLMNAIGASQKGVRCETA